MYFPDWGGNLHAVHANNGKRVWTTKMSSYTGDANSMSRVSPAILPDRLILGDNAIASQPHNGAHVMAVDRLTGALLWSTQVDSHPAAVITASPVVYGNTAYVGVSSDEEALATDPTYACCTFRGSMVAIDVNTGTIKWKTYTVPDNGGDPKQYSGNAIWGPPSLDPARGSVYLSTGNNYTVPQSVLDCQKANIANGTHTDCTAPDDYFNSGMALDMNTGAIKWAHKLSTYDAWTVACTQPTPGVNCPDPAGPDYDFGDGAIYAGGIVGLGQKSGIYWALDPGTGAIKWSTVVGPGSTLGGMEWGSATDGQRIYVQIGNRNRVPYQLANGGPTINWGSWAALDIHDGHIIWQVADPKPGSMDLGALSVANGVVYAGSYGGGMYAMNSTTGQIIWKYENGASVIDGPSIANGMVFWGSGYGHISPGISDNRVFGFALDK